MDLLVFQNSLLQISFVEDGYNLIETLVSVVSLLKEWRHSLLPPRNLRYICRPKLEHGELQHLEFF